VPLAGATPAEIRAVAAALTAAAEKGSAKPATPTEPKPPVSPTPHATVASTQPTKATNPAPVAKNPDPPSFDLPAAAATEAQTQPVAASSTQAAKNPDPPNFDLPAAAATPTKTQPAAANSAHVTKSPDPPPFDLPDAARTTNKAAAAHSDAPSGSGTTRATTQPIQAKSTPPQPATPATLTMRQPVAVHATQVVRNLGLRSSPVVPKESEFYTAARYVLARSKEEKTVRGAPNHIVGLSSSRQLLGVIGGDYTSDHNAALYSSVVFAERAIINEYGARASDLREEWSARIPGAHRSGDPGRYGVADLIIYDIATKEAWVYDAKPVSVLSRPSQLASAEEQVVRYAQNIKRVPMFEGYSGETGPFAAPSTTARSGNVIHVFSVDDDGLRFYKILNQPRKPPVRVPVPNPKDVAAALAILLALAAALRGGSKGPSGPPAPGPIPIPIPAPTGITLS
jgi:hypothetical protein